MYHINMFSPFVFHRILGILRAIVLAYNRGIVLDNIPKSLSCLIQKSWAQHKVDDTYPASVLKSAMNFVSLFSRKLERTLGSELFMQYFSYHSDALHNMHHHNQLDQNYHWMEKTGLGPLFPLDIWESSLQLLSETSLHRLEILHTLHIE